MGETYGKRRCRLSAKEKEPFGKSRLQFRRRVFSDNMYLRTAQLFLGKRRYGGRESATGAVVSIRKDCTTNNRENSIRISGFESGSFCDYARSRSYTAGDLCRRLRATNGRPYNIPGGTAPEGNRNKANRAFGLAKKLLRSCYTQPSGL